jgi:translation initiation factor 1
MGEICSKCGLPQELCVCETIAKENQVIEVKLERRKFGKMNTIVSGLDPKEIDLDMLRKKLKSKFACGGTVKDGHIELQGDHKHKVKQALVDAGFAPETIIVK